RARAVLDEDADPVFPGAQNGRREIDRRTCLGGEHVRDGVDVGNVRTADGVGVDADSVQRLDRAVMQGSPAAGELGHLGAMYGKSTSLVCGNGTEGAKHA